MIFPKEKTHFIDHLFDRFWQRRPALIHASAMLCGTLFALTHHWLALLALALMALSARRFIWPMLTLALISFGYASYRYPIQPFEEIHGRGSLSISEIQQVPTHYGKRYRASALIHHFQSDDGKIELKEQKGYFYSKKLLSLKNSDLIAKGKIVQFRPHGYLFFAKDIDSVSGGEISDYRQGLKGKLQKYLAQKMGDYRSSQLVYALLTGEVTHMTIKMLFNRLGMGHLLAISGFHFAIVVGLIAFLFRGAHRRTVLIALLVLSTAYFSFVGGFTSIKRAYLMLLIFFAGELFRLKSNAINSLGAGVVCLLIWEPPLALNAAFQLSFIATLSILLFYRPVDQALSCLLLKRSPAEVKELSKPALVGYVFNSLLRKALGVNLAVYILCFPLALYVFGSFPLLSLYYNLFIPLVIGAILVGAIASLAIPPLFPLLNRATYFVLEGLEAFPVSLDFRLNVATFPLPLLVFWLMGAVCVGIILSEGERERNRLLLDQNSRHMAKSWGMWRS